MFNYHTYEKLKQEKEVREKEKRKEFKLNQTRKDKNKELVESYDRRINDFIVTMVSNPIKIKDYVHPVENARLELMKETDDKITGRKGFVFKGFVTEKERIKNYLEVREKYINQEQELKYIQFKDNKKAKKGRSRFSYIQPQMRFKPRTELERIFDAINEYSYGRVSRDLINKQLKLLDLNHTKKVKFPNNSSDEESDSSPVNHREKKHLEEPNKEGEVVSDKASLIKDKFKSKRKAVDNSGAKSLMKEYHVKTHFKAASVVAQRDSRTPGLACNELPRASFNQSLLNGSQTKKREKAPLNSYQLHCSKSGFFHKFSKKFSLDEDNLELIESNPILYNLSFNPSKRNEDEKDHDQQKLDYLLDLASEKKYEKAGNRDPKKLLPSEKVNKRKNALFGDEAVQYAKNVDEETEKKKNDEVIYIDNIAIPLSQVNVLANKVLKKCNFFHVKKNNESLKKGSGKLSITSGMTVDEFSKKFNVPK